MFQMLQEHCPPLAHATVTYLGKYQVADVISFMIGYCLRRLGGQAQ